MFLVQSCMAWQSCCAATTATATALASRLSYSGYENPVRQCDIKKSQCKHIIWYRVIIWSKSIASTTEIPNTLGNGWVIARSFQSDAHAQALAWEKETGCVWSLSVAFCWQQRSPFDSFGFSSEQNNLNYVCYFMKIIEQSRDLCAKLQTQKVHSTEHRKIFKITFKAHLLIFSIGFIQRIFTFMQDGNRPGMPKRTRKTEKERWSTKKKRKEIMTKWKIMHWNCFTSAIN